MTRPAPVLNVDVPPTIYCSGSHVEGQVHLNFRSLQYEPIDKVRIILRGRMKTAIQEGFADHARKKQEGRMLVDVTRVLWMHGSDYPPPGSDILRLSFRLKLPDNLPPSMHYTGHLKQASVVYSLEAVGVRRGVLRDDIMIHKPIIVVQSDAFGAQIRMGLFDLPWKKLYLEKKVRKGFWGVGDPGTVRVELLLPDIPVLPLFVQIPYIINVTTTTAPLTRSKADAHPAHKAVFPPPPSIHTDLTFRLIRRTAVRAQDRYDSGDIEAAWFLGLARKTADVDTDLPEKEWVPLGDANGSGDEVGKWVQQARFQSKMYLNVPPTFDVRMIGCKYFLRLKVPFPGAGNDATLEVPVEVVSGIDQATARSHLQVESQLQRSRDRVHLDPSTLELATLDLPPAYWDVTD